MPSGRRARCYRCARTVFRTDELKSKRDPDGNGADTIGLLVRRATQARAWTTYGVPLPRMDLTKRLGNLPPNICRRVFWRTSAHDAKKWKLDVEVLETKQLEALKMGSSCRSQRALAQAPRLIVLKYTGRRQRCSDRARPQRHQVRLRRISIKPWQAMDE